MTTHQPRAYQARDEQRIYEAWREHPNVLYQLATGGGKTYVLSRVVQAMNVATSVIAHRSELVTQISTALGREGVRHAVIGSDTTRRNAVSLHLDEFGRSYVEPSARVRVASVDTLIGMTPSDPWLHQVGLWVTDEAHHVLTGNKWGKACAMFPNARGLGVTATPVRADGKGLGRRADGLFDTLIVGPTMRELINDGHLTDYDVVMPTSDIDLSDVPVTASGDYSPEKLKTARRRSRITGDVVANYLKFAKGKRAVVFDTDVDTATDTAMAFRAAGVRAEVVSAKTPDLLRTRLLKQFRTGDVEVLVNVDLFGEGFDVPAIEVVVMARPTASYALFAQQFGRALRTLPGKTRALIIDHVGNVIRHGLPDAPRAWSLNRRERRARSTPQDAIPLRACLNPECLRVYERVLVACPYCGHVVTPADRSAPERVDGDLTLLDPAVLARMRGEAEAVAAAPAFPFGATPEVVGAIKKRHRSRVEAHADLAEAIATWAGWQSHLGRGEAESYRRFYFEFGLDALSAKALQTADASALAERINVRLAAHNVTAAP